jgi:hypothetical protein
MGRKTRTKKPKKEVENNKTEKTTKNDSDEQFRF